MPSGVYLSSELRGLIYHLSIILEYDAQQIYECIFHSHPSRISLKYLEGLIRRFKGNNDSSIAYMLGPSERLGNSKRMLKGDEIDALLYLINTHKQTKIRILTNTFNHLYYNPLLDAATPSQSTVFRTLKRARISLKVVELRHIRCDEAEGLEFLTRLSHVDPFNLIDIDETASDGDSFREKYGYETVGEKCLINQIAIGDKTYSTIAAVSPLGFLCCNIYENSIGSEDFCLFVENELSAFIAPESYLIIDNASIHHTDEVRIALEDVCNGQYYYSAKYSPHLKPIETCFAVIKKEVINDAAAINDPVGSINRAFNKYRIGGISSHKILPHWNIYFNLHANV
jgi:transposase